MSIHISSSINHPLLINMGKRDLSSRVVQCLWVLSTLVTPLVADDFTDESTVDYASFQVNVAQPPRDEFNSTESPQLVSVMREDLVNYRPTLGALRQILLRFPLQECCPPWKNLTTDSEIQEEHKRKYGKSKVGLRPEDLMNELKRVFLNITYLSIDGQPGDSEREKYYHFYDGVHYYLRLMKVAHEYLDSNSSGKTRIMESEFNRSFRRHVKSIVFRVQQEPIMSSFMNELFTKNGTMNSHFEYYEDFIRYTQFGAYYAKNVSIIRESVQVFDQICNHLGAIELYSNFTRPSKLYEMIQRMSQELYLIRSELMQVISARVRGNRQDLRRIFARLDEIVHSKPYIRMLGDQYSSSPPYFSTFVRQLTYLLNLYLNNSLTQVTFYDQLSELPEDFIVLGAGIARSYELKEVPRYTKFDSDLYNWANSASSTAAIKDGQKKNSTLPSQVDPRGNSRSLLTRFFSR